MLSVSIRDRGSCANDVRKMQRQAPLTLLHYFHAGCCSVRINAAAVNPRGIKEIKVIGTNQKESVWQHCPKRSTENRVTQLKNDNK